MKNIFKFKKHTLCLIFFITLNLQGFLIQNSEAAADTACVINGAGSVAPINNGATGFDCWGKPSVQTVNFFKVALCKDTLAAPAAITTVTPIDLTSCTTVWENAAGQSVNVSVGLTAPLTGTASIPEPGSYKTLYIEISPTFIYQILARFAAANMKRGTVLSGGNLCWTVANTVQFSKSATVVASALASIQCGAVPAAGNTTYTFNSFDAGNTVTLTDIRQPSGRTFRAALLKTNGTLIATPANDTIVTGTKLGAWVANPIKITPDTTDFVVEFSNSAGIGALLDAADDLVGIDPGAFDIFITVN
jgi:hypothetical protein